MSETVERSVAVLPTVMVVMERVSPVSSSESAVASPEPEMRLVTVEADFL